MKELFSRIDKDNSGCLELKEVILFMKALTDDLSEDNITAIFENLDSDKSASIDFEEFMVNYYKYALKSSLFFRCCLIKSHVLGGNQLIIPTEMVSMRMKSGISSI